MGVAPGTVSEKSRQNLTGGSRKGIPNKTTVALKAMILNALNEAGGQQYLIDRAMDEPKAFMALLGRILPTEITADVKVDLAGLIDAMRRARDA